MIVIIRFALAPERSCVYKYKKITKNENTLKKNVELI